MKKCILQLWQRFLELSKLGRRSTMNPSDRPVFDIQEKIQQKIKKITHRPTTVILPPIPMAQVTVQTIHIPLIRPEEIRQTIQESLQAQLPNVGLRKRQPSIIRQSISEKDIATITEALRSFPGHDVRDLF